MPSVTGSGALGYEGAALATVASGGLAEFAFEGSVEGGFRLVAEAAAAIRALSEEELDRAATVSLYSDAPLTCQFMLEDHAVRHSYHHLAAIKAALGR